MSKKDFLNQPITSGKREIAPPQTFRLQGIMPQPGLRRLETKAAKAAAADASPFDNEIVPTEIDRSVRTDRHGSHVSRAQEALKAIDLRRAS